MTLISLLRLCQAQHVSGTIMPIVSLTAFGPETNPSCLHLISIQQQLENQTTYVVPNAIVVSSWWWA